MTGYPKITVITVCFNAEKTIERTIKSIIKQEYPNLEYIVIDGGSVDNTLKIINKYIQHVSYVRSEKDEGIYDAMNKGLSKATGEWVVFLNADDVFTDGALKEVSKAIQEHPQSEAIIGDTYVVEKINKNLNITLAISKIDSQTIFYAPPFCHQSLFLRKKCYDELGSFNLKYKIAADYEYTLRLFKNDFSYFILKKPLVIFAGDGASSNVLKTTCEHALCQLEHGCSIFSTTKNLLLKNIKYYGLRTMQYLKVSVLINWWRKKAVSYGLRKQSLDYISLSEQETELLIKKYNLI